LVLIDRFLLSFFSSATTVSNNFTPPECTTKQIIPAATLMWQQFLAIQYKNLVYWKRNRISLLSMFLMTTVAFLGITHVSWSTSEAQRSPTRVSMEKLLDPQILFVAGTSKHSVEMKRLNELFKRNVERDYGKFLALENEDLTNGERKPELLEITVATYLFVCSAFEYIKDR
jgi:hypothetical protein